MRDDCNDACFARRVVVVVETADAYEKLAPPLLNRFEKQVRKFLLSTPSGGGGVLLITRTIVVGP